ncbi:hypothetical protein [Methylobacterium sp. A54F]
MKKFLFLFLATMLCFPLMAKAECSSSQIVSLASAGFSKEEIKRICGEGITTANPVTIVLRNELIEYVLNSVGDVRSDIDLGDTGRVSGLEFKICEPTSVDKARVLVVAALDTSETRKPSHSKGIFADNDCSAPLSATADRIVATADPSRWVPIAAQQIFISEIIVEAGSAGLIGRISKIDYPNSSSINSESRARILSSIKAKDDIVFRTHALRVPLFVGKSDYKIVPAGENAFVEVKFFKSYVGVVTALKEASIKSQSKERLEALSAKLNSVANANIAVLVPIAEANELVQSYLKYVAISVPTTPLIGDLVFKKLGVGVAANNLVINGSFLDSQTNAYDFAVQLNGKDLLFKSAEISPVSVVCNPENIASYAACILRNSAKVEISKSISQMMTLFGTGKRFIPDTHEAPVSLNDIQLNLKIAVIEQELQQENVQGVGHIGVESR